MVGENVTAEGLAGDARAARDGDNNGGKVAFKVLRALGVVFLTTAMTACANDKNYFSIGGVIVILGCIIGFLFYANIIWESWKNDEQTPLHSAAMKGQTETVLALIKKGVTINKRDSLGQTPLHNAAWYGKTETALILVKHGADIDAIDNDGLTPLHLAAWFGRTETALALVRHGADLFARTDAEGTPLDIAIKGHGKGSEITGVLREAMKKRGGK